MKSIDSMRFQSPDKAYSIGLGDFDCVSNPTENDITRADEILTCRRIEAYRTRRRKTEDYKSDQLPDWVTKRVVYVTYDSMID